MIFVDEFPTYDDFKEIKDKYDELKKKYIDVTARLAEVQEGCDIYKNLYDKYNDSNGKLIKENDELKRKLHYILGGGILPETLEPVLSETPSVIINTKSVNITFDNHTNNFKEE